MNNHRRQGFWFPLLGLGFAIAGADKLLGVRGYEALFARWGWSRTILRLIGGAEFAGGVMVASPLLLRRGGQLLTVASTAVLTKELRTEDSDLALPRFLLLLASLAAIFF